MPKSVSKAALLTMAVCCLPLAAVAEVSDKVPTIAQLWTQAAIVGIAAFLAARFRLWLGFMVLPITLFLAWATHEVVADPYVGPAIRAEQRQPYVFSAYGSILLLVSLHAAGFAAGSTRSRNKRAADENT